MKSAPEFFRKFQQVLHGFRYGELIRNFCLLANLRKKWNLENCKKTIAGIVYSHMSHFATRPKFQQHESGNRIGKYMPNSYRNLQKINENGIGSHSNCRYHFHLIVAPFPEVFGGQNGERPPFLGFWGPKSLISPKNGILGRPAQNLT